MTAAAGTGRARPHTGVWVLTSFTVAFVIAMAIVALKGAGNYGTSLALRGSARFSFLLFWGAYAGGLLRHAPLAWLKRLSSHRRDFGLSFAAAHSVHLGLILWLYYVSSEQPVSTQTAIVDGIGFGFMYLMAVFSFDIARKALNPLAWRILFNIWLEYIAYVFATDFILGHLHDGKMQSVLYWPFVLMLAGTALLRWTSGARWLLTRAWDAGRSPGPA
jgi:hypothetical protein